MLRGEVESAWLALWMTATVLLGGTKPYRQTAPKDQPQIEKQDNGIFCTGEGGAAGPRRRTYLQRNGSNKVASKAQR